MEKDERLFTVRHQQRITVEWMDGQKRELVVDQIRVKNGIVIFERDHSVLLSAPRENLHHWR